MSEKTSVVYVQSTGPGGRQTIADVEKALRILKKKMNDDGTTAEIKKRKHYRKPSEIKNEDKRKRLKTIAKAQRKERAKDEIR